MQIFKLNPQCKNYVWGGDKLRREYGKKSSVDVIAESWELSFHEDGPTELSDGRLLKDVVTPAELGENCADFQCFPLLIKLIDAQKDLSVQVHPSDEYALKNENSYGKTEMWYVVEADDGAGIYLGFKEKVSKTQVLDAVSSGNLLNLLNFYPVKSGESYFIPSGTVHAIGAGCLMCEIQQNSNLTYRVYDYGRVGADGKPRELHVDKALDVINFDKFALSKVQNNSPFGEVLGACRYFTSVKIQINGAERYILDGKTFWCLTCVDGCGEVDGVKFQKGDSLFVPANYGEINISGKCQIIATFVDKVKK